MYKIYRLTGSCYTYLGLSHINVVSTHVFHELYGFAQNPYSRIFHRTPQNVTNPPRLRYIIQLIILIVSYKHVQAACMFYPELHTTANTQL